MQKFIEKEDGVFISDKIIFSEDGKTVREVQGDTELEIDKEWPLTLFRYMPFSRLYTEIEKKQITFLSPELWKDPFESAFHKLGNGIDLKCLCFTYNGSIGEEWAWKAYGCDEQLVRIEINFSKLVYTLSDITKSPKQGTRFYICVCDYSKDKKALISDMTKFKKAGGIKKLEDFLNLMSHKRKAFAGEREIRIFAVDEGLDKSDAISIFPVDYKKFMTRVLLEPLDPFSDKLRDGYYTQLQDIHNEGIKTYLQKFSIKTQQSHLYETK